MSDEQKTPNDEDDLDSMSGNDSTHDSSKSLNSVSFPVAVSGPARISPLEIFKASKMWWVAFACLLIAAGIVWYSIPPSGTEITIHFPDGHGLKPEDELRHRGIHVGSVRIVELNKNLSGVDVKVVLNPDASALAVEGSRFWIVRPEVSLRRISGLETAVGAKYIGVSPGSSDAKPVFVFDGLATMPVDGFDDDGLEFILRGERNFSLSPGSPVTYRGVQVGQIISTGLSPDSNYADMRGRIDPNFKSLLRSNSKFWVTSGLRIDGGVVRGFKFDTESIESILRGGVSFITLNDDEVSEEIEPGQIFILNRRAEEEWLTAQNTFSTRSFDSIHTINLIARWKQKRFIQEVAKNRKAIGIAIAKDAQSSILLMPWDISEQNPRAVKETFRINFVIPGEAMNPTEDRLDVTKISEIISGVSKTELNEVVKNAISLDNFREPDRTEDCCAVKTVKGPGGIATICLRIGQHEIRQTEDIWHIATEIQETSAAWHGAPVASQSDGKIIGILLDKAGSAIVVPFSKSWF